MPWSGGLPYELGEPPVKGLLPTLKACAGGTAGTTLLTPHAETAGGALAGGDTATLALEPLPGTRGGLEVVEGEYCTLSVIEG